jgi:hypothetical protein
MCVRVLFAYSPIITDPTSGSPSQRRTRVTSVWQRLGALRISAGILRSCGVSRSCLWKEVQ